MKHSLTSDISMLTGVLMIGAALGLGLGVALQPADALPPCPAEDSTGCYWDASERGNGHGSDFVSPKGE